MRPTLWGCGQSRDGSEDTVWGQFPCLHMMVVWEAPVPFDGPPPLTKCDFNILQLCSNLLGYSVRQTSRFREMTKSYHCHKTNK